MSTTDSENFVQKRFRGKNVEKQETANILHNKRQKKYILNHPENAKKLHRERQQQYRQKHSNDHTKEIDRQRKKRYREEHSNEYDSKHTCTTNLEDPDAENMGKRTIPLFFNNNIKQEDDSSEDDSEDDSKHDNEDNLSEDDSKHDNEDNLSEDDFDQYINNSNKYYEKNTYTCMEDLEDVEINFIKTEMLPDEELKKYRQCKNDATFQLIYNACGAHLYNFGNHEIRDEEAILKEFNQNIITSDDIVQRTNDYVKTMAPNNTKFEYCASCGILSIQQPEFENNSENGKSYIAEPIKVQDLDILICGPPQNIYEWLSRSTTTSTNRRL